MLKNIITGSSNTLENLNESVKEEVYTKFEHDVNLQGLMGAPPCFSRLADFKTDNNPYGNEYLRKFIEEGNFVAIEAGQPRLSISQDDYIEGAVDVEGEEDIAAGLIDSIQQSTDGELFRFETAMDKYWRDVRYLTSTCAYMLGIGDEIEALLGSENSVVLENGFRTFDWGSYSSSFLEEHTDGSREYVTFYNDGIIEASENVSNSVGPTSIESNINNNAITNNPVANMMGEVAMLTGQDVGSAIDDIEDASGEDITQSRGVFRRVKDLFTGGSSAMNIKMNLPDVWQDTNYSKDYNLEFKLTTPHGDPVSVYMNIIVPLCHLIPLISARQIGVSNSYIAGYILRIYCKGMVNLDYGMATNVSIRRNQESVSINGLPTEIDVTMTVTDLMPMLALPEEMSHNNIRDVVGLMGYLGTLTGFNTTYYTFGRSAQDFITRKWEDTLGKLRPSHIATATRERGRAFRNRWASRASNKIRNLF